MSVHDAQPNDIYVDNTGKLWRCVGVCHEPTVIFEEVEGRTAAPPDLTMQAQGQLLAQQYRAPEAPPIIKDRKSGGVGGFMWNGWKRIFRKETI